MWSSTTSKVFVLYFLGIVFLGGIAPSHAIVRYKFVVRESSHTRLCTNKTMLTVTCINTDLCRHGVKMPRYPWSDGPEYVTQCPISPGTMFSQRVILSDEVGTLWWHAHSEWWRASVYGAFIILPQKKNGYPFPTPHAQVPILLGEWWNANVQEVMEEFLANGVTPMFLMLSS
ncbi:UNVERIFIED_CONTAM: Laccase-15 [Sesamum calycinum]|uniref:Laccase-15 n=1 Tax=Sesamum calycinum TaxID=2727403 RepID=A0AAW2IWH3_9LAMI